MSIERKKERKKERNCSHNEKLCQYPVCRKYPAAESGLSGKCLLLSGCKSNTESKGLQRSVTNPDRKIKRQIAVDLCYVESRVVEISACICVKYDVGICPHKMEHTGVLIEYK